MKKLFTLWMLLLCMVVGVKAEGGTEKAQNTGTKDTPITGTSYTIDGTYIAGKGGEMAGAMDNKGVKFRTGQNGATLEFTVNTGYVITDFKLYAISNYTLKDGASEPCIAVTKVEVDGTETAFTGGGEFPAKGSSTSGSVILSDISASQKIVLFFDNSNSSGNQINGYYEITWEKAVSQTPIGTTITPATATISVGQTITLTGSFTGGDFTGEWVSDNESVATVSSSGVVTAIAPGTANITYQWTTDNTQDAYKATATITVTDEPLGTSVSPASATIVAGKTTTLTGAFEGGAFEGEWLSDDESVATVSQTGVVTGVAEGTAHITYQWAEDQSKDAYKATATITVVEAFNKEALNTVKTYDFAHWGATTLTIENASVGKIYNAANNVNNDVFRCTNDGLTSIAIQAVLSNSRGWTINNDGLYEGSGAGRCAAVCDVKKGQYIEFYHNSENSFYTRNNGEDEGAKKLPLVEEKGHHVYKVLEDGIVGFELAKGHYVTSINIYEKKTGTPTSLTFSTTTAYATLGEEFTEPTLTKNPEDLAGIVYSSSNTGVATVDESTGEVTLIAGGETTITATFEGTSEYWSATGSYKLIVTDPNLIVFGLTQDDLTTSTGVTTTTTYLGENVTMVASSATMGSSSSTRNLTNGYESLTAAGAACQRNNLCSGATDFVEESYYAFTLNIASGYKITINELFGDLYYDTSRSGKYKFAVYSGESKVWEASSSDYVAIGGSNKSKKTLDVSSVTALKDLTGNIQVRMVWYQNGSSSYVALKDFNATLKIEEDTRVTYDLTTNSSPAEGGTISRDPAAGAYEEGTEVTLTATPNEGYYFVNWTDANGEELATTAEYQYTTTAEAVTLTANFAKYPMVTFAKGESGAIGELPAAANVTTGEFTIPANKTLYVEGKTLTAWNDGETDYAIGDTISNITADVTLTPVFTDNSFSLDFLLNNVTAKFPFTQNGGAPILKAEGKSNPTTMSVAQASYNGLFMDILMSVDATNGKFNNNQGDMNTCQINATTLITLPATYGMKVTINKEFSTSFLGDTDNTGTTKSGSTTWTYTGDEDVVTLTINESNRYPTEMTVTYPKTAIKKTISAAGYATHCSSSALDFKAVEGLTAYIATIQSKQISFEEMDDLPAGTGMLLKGEAGEYIIPIIPSSSNDDATTENIFIGVTEETLVETPGIFVLMDGDDGVGFYRTLNAFTVGANSAYLPATVASEARSFIGFNDETTGIDELKATTNSNAVYNLKGQRVKPTKGLYIQNGKKLFMK